MWFAFPAHYKTPFCQNRKKKAIDDNRNTSQKEKKEKEIYTYIDRVVIRAFEPLRVDVTNEMCLFENSLGRYRPSFL
jgi:hypothetical protein